MPFDFMHPTAHQSAPDHTPARAPARARVLHEIFEAQADTRPDDVAIIFGHEEVMYGELEARANRLAAHLPARRVGRGSLVALLHPRSPDGYAALLGILKAGAAYLPLDPAYPPDRVAAILEDSGASAMVTTGPLARAAP